MTDVSPELSNRPNVLLMLQEGLPDEIEVEARTHLERPDLKFAVLRQPGGPYAGIELYLPSAIALFVAAGFFNGMLQEGGKDAYVALKKAAVALWKRAVGLDLVSIGTAGKMHESRCYSLVYSITGEVVSGINFKFIVQTEISALDLEAGVGAFVDLIDDLHNDRVSEENIKALLTYKPVGGTVLVTFDAGRRLIIPVNAFDGRC